MYGSVLYLAAKLLHHQEEDQRTCTCQYFFPDHFLTEWTLRRFIDSPKGSKSKHVWNQLLSAKYKKQLTSPPPPCSTAPTKFMSWFLLHLGFLQKVKKEKSEGKLQHCAALRCSQAVTTIADGHSEPHLCLKAMHSCEHWDQFQG